MDNHEMESLANPTYPISAAQKTSFAFATWMSFLPEVNSSTGPDANLSMCCCCDFSNSEATTTLVDDRIVRLPCNCPWRRGCLERYLSPDFRNEDCCPRCEFSLFEPLNLDAWMQALESPNAEELGKGDCRVSCGICMREYADPLPAAPAAETKSESCDSPVKISCGHIFGRECLQHWLSPKKGKGNSCPLCRKELFSPWSPRHDDSTEDPLEGLDDSTEDPSEGIDISTLTLDDIDYLTVDDLEWLLPVFNTLRRGILLRVLGDARLVRLEEKIETLLRLEHVVQIMRQTILPYDDTSP